LIEQFSGVYRDHCLDDLAGQPANERRYGLTNLRKLRAARGLFPFQGERLVMEQFFQLNHRRYAFFWCLGMRTEWQRKRQKQTEINSTKQEGHVLQFKLAI
jgi:hypothetical protein